MVISFQPVRVDAEEGDGLLVFADARLVGVLVRLSEEHEDLAGRWFLEAGFGTWVERHNPVFATLDEAEEWVARRS